MSSLLLTSESVVVTSMDHDKAVTAVNSVSSLIVDALPCSLSDWSPREPSDEKNSKYTIAWFNNFSTQSLSTLLVPYQSILILAIFRGRLWQ